MARAESDRYQYRTGRPDWRGWFIEDESLMPGGGKFDAATVAVNTFGRKPLESGFIVGRNQVEIDARGPFRKAVAGDIQVYVLAFEVRNLDVQNDIDLVRPQSGMIIKENYLPDQTHLGVMRADLLKSYILTKGV